MPPITERFGERLQLTSWPRTGIPEVVWLTLLHDEDEELGMRAAATLSKLARTTMPRSKTAFCLVSHFNTLTTTDGAAIWNQVSETDQVVLMAALQPLIAGYPTCPLNRVLPAVPDTPDLPRLKRVLDSLFDKTSRESTMSLATMLYLTVNAGLLFLRPQSRLVNLEGIREYPTTEHSRMMASEVRSLTIMEFMPPRYDQTLWPTEFWNRGLELEACTYD
ncbi:MAG TPA: hypothetical protein VJ276_13335 [Thermoanaerobaculia bacterium]|nr:hypothetical protein [Thermoanaerobaculia bacterium]